MTSRTLFSSILVLLTVAGIHAATAREHPATLDSTGRVTYRFEEEVAFGQNDATATIRVPDIFDINDVDVTVYIDHTWDGDIHMTLRSPDGTTIVLFSALGGSGHNLHDTEFNDQAEQSIQSGAPPFTGSFRPLEALSAFHGESGVGDWVLRMHDTFPNADDGLLHWWELTLGDRIGGVVEGYVTRLADNSPLEGVRVEFVDTPYFVESDSTGFYRIIGPEGTYDLLVSYPFWCGETVLDIELVNLDTTDLDFSLGKPAASSSRSSLNFLTEVDSVESITLELSNSGNCDLQWSIFSYADWVRFDVSEGLVAEGESTMIVPIVDAEGLSIGDYQSRIEIAHNAEGSPIVLPVFLSVTEPVSAVPQHGEIPTAFELRGSYPNPFNASATIEFALPIESEIELNLYSIEGKLAQRLTDGRRAAGVHRYQFEAAGLASGVYFAALRAGDFHATHKMILLK